jgi:hypothetical protein
MYERSYIGKNRNEIGFSCSMFISFNQAGFIPTQPSYPWLIMRNAYLFMLAFRIKKDA